MRKLMLLLLLSATFTGFAQNDSPAINTSGQNSNGGDELAANNGYPVYLFSDTLFYVKTRLASLIPKERAANISSRLLKVYEDELVKPDDISIYANGNYMDIVCGETIIMSVSENDAELAGMTNVELASI